MTLEERQGEMEAAEAALAIFRKTPTRIPKYRNQVRMARNSYRKSQTK
jgi:hypothetical protein